MILDVYDLKMFIIHVCVGGSPNGTMGFIGCIKNLRILGEYFELTKHVTDGIHGGEFISF